MAIDNNKIKDIVSSNENTFIDKELVKRRFSKAKNYNRQAIVQSYVHTKILNYIDNNSKQSFNKVLEVGCGTGILTQLVEKKYSIINWVLNDLTDSIIKEDVFTSNRLSRVEYIIGDAENIDLGNNYDLIISSSSIQWLHNPIKFINRLIGKLADNGVIIISTFSSNNLLEIKHLLGVGLNYNTVKDFQKGINTKNFNIEIEEELYTLEFDTPMDVLKHLKGTGVTAVAGESFSWNKSKLKEFEYNYNQLYKNSNNKVSLTYHPLYIYIHK